MNWLSNLGAIAELLLEVIAAFKKTEVQQLAINLKNAKTPQEKTNVAMAIASHMYNP